MKAFALKILLPLIFVSSLSYGLDGPGHYYGSWTTMYDVKGVSHESVIIYTPEYFIYAVYESESRNFLRAGGGSWTLTGKGLVHKFEFDSQTPDNVGKEVILPAEDHKEDYRVTRGSVIGVKEALNWMQLDKGNSDMFGAWRITQRERNGGMSTIQLGPRRTMKVLSGTRFQWAAYNIETKEFMGTGGGSYTAKDGKYIENIEFFSRDNNRVGASLSFDFELKDGDWHHSGLSSKGSPIYEVWSLYPH